ncbi:MAG: polyhydroxyalkanoate synthesis repressor PhaR [Roseomonas sp.]|jgi:polyhydroxyalkanoate synthesis repressor PhaR|nr:polyhydroxyalkanoate synthesis repressor PhaR [Roseomonas sp.]
MSGRQSPEPGEQKALPPIVVKKYANRRLYNTETSSYVTLDDLAAMVRAGRDFVVYDAKSGEDLTRSVLTQIIVEQEGKGQNMLPTSVLRQLIGLYGDNLQSLVPRYLEAAMASFAQQQEQMRDTLSKTMSGFMPFPSSVSDMQEVSKQNIAMMERAMSLFTPFARREENAPSDETEALKKEIEALRGELASLKSRNKG